MKISKADVVIGGQVALPKQCYRVRVTNAEFGKASSGNPMTTLNCEIIEPETIEQDGKPLRIAGLSFSLYLVHVASLVGKQRESSQAGVIRFMEKIGAEMEEDENGDPVWDSDLTQEYFRGREFDMILSSEKRIKRLPADKSKGQKYGEGTPILDGEGNEISDGYSILANLNDVPDNCRPSKVELPF